MIIHLALAGTDDALGDKQFDKLTLEELDAIGFVSWFVSDTFVKLMSL